MISRGARLPRLLPPCFVMKRRAKISIEPKSTPPTSEGIDALSSMTIDDSYHRLLKTVAGDTD